MPARRRLGGDSGRGGTGIRPHKLAAYLYQLAYLYTSFYDKCPVLKADTREQVENRLFLCDVTARTLPQGMALLGIRTPERLRPVRDQAGGAPPALESVAYEMWSASSSALKRFRKRLTMRFVSWSGSEMPYIAFTLSPNSRGLGKLPLIDCLKAW